MSLDSKNKQFHKKKPKLLKHKCTACTAYKCTNYWPLTDNNVLIYSENTFFISTYETKEVFLMFKYVR